MEIRETTEKEKATQIDDVPLYEVVMQDEYDNLYLLGFYGSLDDSIDDINTFIGAYDDERAIPFKKGDLALHESTLGACFDRQVEWEDENDCPGDVWVRGFALSAKSVKEKAAEILAAHSRAAKDKED
nr:MAG TPA: hypothetical protein [Bacteriophage sp.]